MTETLSPQDTQKFRAAQQGRNRVIAVLIVVWVAGMWALTFVKGQEAVAQRMQQGAAAASHGSK